MPLRRLRCTQDGFRRALHLQDGSRGQYNCSVNSRFVWMAQVHQHLPTSCGHASDWCIDSSAGPEDQQIRQDAQDLCPAARPAAWTQAAAARPAQDRPVPQPHKDVPKCHCEGVMRADQSGGCQASLRMSRSWHPQPGLTRQQALTWAIVFELMRLPAAWLTSDG